MLFVTSPVAPAPKHDSATLEKDLKGWIGNKENRDSGVCRKQVSGTIQPPMKLSQKFEEALIYATRAHGDQMRKKTGIPFIAHILGVTAVALEYGANEAEATGALLHDTVEDCGGVERLRDIREKFGDDVAGIVNGCTDTYEAPKPPWLERKRSYIEHLKESDSSTRLVSASDKLHNTRAILAELRRHGLGVFERFSGKKDGTLWYYRMLVTTFRRHGDHADLIDELDRVVSEIEKFVREN